MGMEMRFLSLFCPLGEESRLKGGWVVPVVLE